MLFVGIRLVGWHLWVGIKGIGVLSFPGSRSPALRPLPEPPLDDGDQKRRQCDDDHDEQIRPSAFRLQAASIHSTVLFQAPFGFVPSGSAMDLRISVSAWRFFIP